jgi:hypothetical protein
MTSTLLNEDVLLYGPNTGYDLGAMVAIQYETVGTDKYFTGVQYALNGVLREIVYPYDWTATLASPARSWSTDIPSGSYITQIQLFTPTGASGVGGPSQRIVFTDKQGTSYAYYHQMTYGPGFPESQVLNISTRPNGQSPGVTIVHDSILGASGPRLTWEFVNAAIGKTIVGATNSFNASSLVTFSATSGQVALFGDHTVGVGLLRPVQFGSHTLTISLGDVTTAGVRVSTSESCTINWDDVAIDTNTIGCIVKDFTGLSYSSLNQFTETVPLLIKTANGVGDFAIRRMAWPAGHVSIECRNATYGADTSMWTISLVATGFLAGDSVVTASMSNIVTLQEVHNGTSSGPDDAGSWNQGVLIQRPLSMRTTGVNDLVTSYFATIMDDGGFNLLPGTYRIRWAVPGMGVNQFVSVLQHIVADNDIFDSVVTPDRLPASANQGMYLGRLAYSATGAAANLDRSEGDAVIAISGQHGTSANGALFQLKAVAQTSAKKYGFGLLANATLKTVVYDATAGAPQHLLSWVEVIRYSGSPILTT